MVHCTQEVGTDREMGTHSGRERLFRWDTQTDTQQGGDGRLVAWRSLGGGLQAGSMGERGAPERLNHPP